MSKIALQKRDGITLTCFYHCTATDKGIVLKFCFRVVCMYIDNISSSFWDNLKIWILLVFIFETIKMSFGGQNCNKNLQLGVIIL